MRVKFKRFDTWFKNDHEQILKNRKVLVGPNNYNNRVTMQDLRSAYNAATLDARKAMNTLTDRIEELEALVDELSK